LNEGRLRIIDIEIMRLKTEMARGEEKLTWMPRKDPETTRLNYHVGNLHGQIRKLTILANQGYLVFYCSRCGERFNTARDRTLHVKNHE